MPFIKMPSRSPFALWAKAASVGIHHAIRSNTVSDSLLFLKSWRENPAKVGAILPSGPALAAAITREISSVHAPILELGCGTGVFTQKIIERGVASQELVLVELDPFFVSNLQTKFPQAQILCVDACRLNLVHTGAEHAPGAAVCGLPLRNMSVKQQYRLLQGVFRVLRKSSALYLFSYGWRCPVSSDLLARLGLQAELQDTVLLNVPPARVWKIESLDNSA
ncbi:methyltransferase domain-containing protein [Alcaligenaceae bacterium]|nr:methyltransferase domain-containing protein [Alcaligenaceae bacterium]